MYSNLFFLQNLVFKTYVFAVSVIIRHIIPNCGV